MPAFEQKNLPDDPDNDQRKQWIYEPE